MTQSARQQKDAMEFAQVMCYFAYTGILRWLRHALVLTQRNNLHFAMIFNQVSCYFVAIPTSECPCNITDVSGCNLSECSTRMDSNDLCNANTTLPDENTNYDVNNCPGSTDIFRCTQQGT